MALLAVVDSLDGLSEDIAKEYKQRDDGKFVLDVTPAGSLELTDVSGLTRSLEKERGNAKIAAERLAAFGDLDPTKAREALEKVAEMADWDPSKEVAERMKVRESQLLEKHKSELDTIAKERDTLSTELQKNLVTNAAITALQKSGGSVALLLPIVERHTRMRKTEDGRFIAEVIDKDGNPRVGDGQGNPMTIPDFVEELKGQEEYAPAFKGTGSTGSGAGEGAAGAGTAGAGGPGRAGAPRTITREEAASGDFLQEIAEGKVAVDLGE